MSKTFISAEAEAYFDEKTYDYYETGRNKGVLVANLVLEALDAYVTTGDDIVRVVTETQELLQQYDYLDTTLTEKDFSEAMQLVVDVSPLGEAVRNACRDNLNIKTLKKQKFQAPPLN